ncbi:unnamed protein product, partial [Scytosiphon promiscuus]
MNLFRAIPQWLAGQLSEYVDNVDFDSLRAGLWSGDLILRNLQVRTDVSRKLHLPIVLKQGSVELVRIQVPWKTFASGRASLHVSGLTLVLEPLGSANYDDEIERGLRDAIFAKKQELLANAEARLAGVQAKSGWGARLGSFLAGSFMARIVRNLSVSVENIHVVWLQAEHAQTSPLQSPGSAEKCLTPSPSAVGIYLRRLAVSPTSFPSAATPVDNISHSPARGGRGVSGGGGGGSGASSPKTKPKSGVSAIPDTAVKKAIELDSLLAYTKESTADWLVDVPPLDSDDHDGGGAGSEGSHSDDGRRLRPTPPFQDLAAGIPGAATVGVTATATVPGRAFAASCTSSPAKGEGKSRKTLASGGCRGDTAPVCIVRPLRAQGTLLIRKPGAATAAVVPSVDGGSNPAGGGGSRADGSAEGTGTRGTVERPPLLAVSLDVEEIALQVDVRQYAVLNAAVSALTMSHRRFKFRTMRPTTSVLDNPEAWWRYAIRCVMIEQRRDAHRGSAGLSLTWQGLLSRVRLLSRYMSVYRRLLTVGMRPLDAAAGTPSASATTARKPPHPAARRESTEEGARPRGKTGAMQTAGASGLRGSLEGGVSLSEMSMFDVGAAGGDGVSDDGENDGRGSGEERWTMNWVGGSSAEIRKLAERIRTRFGRGAVVRKNYSTEARKEFQVSEAEMRGMLALEMELSVEEILVYRDVARKSIEKSAAGHTPAGVVGRTFQWLAGTAAPSATPTHSVENPTNKGPQSPRRNGPSPSPARRIVGGGEGGGSTIDADPTTNSASEEDKSDFSAWTGINAVELGQAASLFQSHWVEAGLSPEVEEDPAARNQVWFSWQVDVKEASVQLSQPRLLPRVRLGKVAPGPSPSPSLSPGPSRENGSGDCSRSVPLQLPGRYTSDSDGKHGRSVTVLLRFVVSRARACVGIRTEKGFVVDASVHAVEASGVGGITCLMINPAVLWGGAGGDDTARKSWDHGEDSALNVFMDVRRTDREASLASVAGELEMEEQGDGAKLLKSKASTIPFHFAFFFLSFVYSMNLEVVTRMAPVELTISPQLLSPLAYFLHSSKVSTPGLILPARSPALDNLRVLAAGCRACSTKGHVSDVLRARGTKDVDVRAAGFNVRFVLDPHSATAAAAHPPSPGGSTGDEEMGGVTSEEEDPFSVAERRSRRARGSH